MMNKKKYFSVVPFGKHPIVLTYKGIKPIAATGF